MLSTSQRETLPLPNSWFAPLIFAIAIAVASCGGGSGGSEEPRAGDAQPAALIAAPQASYLSGSLLQLSLTGATGAADVTATVGGTSAPITEVDGTILLKLPALPTGTHQLVISSGGSSSTTEVHIEAPSLPATATVYADSVVASVITQLQNAQVANPQSENAPFLAALEKKLLELRPMIATMSEQEARELSYSLLAFGVAALPGTDVMQLRASGAIETATGCIAKAWQYKRTVVAVIASFGGASWGLTVLATPGGAHPWVALGTIAALSTGIIMLESAKTQISAIGSACIEPLGTLFVSDSQSGATDNFNFTAGVKRTFQALTNVQLMPDVKVQIEPDTTRLKAAIRTTWEALKQVGSLLLPGTTPPDLSEQENVFSGLFNPRQVPARAEDYVVTHVSDPRIKVEIIPTVAGELQFLASFTGDPIEGTTTFAFSLSRVAGGGDAGVKVARITYTAPACTIAASLPGRHTLSSDSGSPSQDDVLDFAPDGTWKGVTNYYYSTGETHDASAQYGTWTYFCSANVLEIKNGIWGNVFRFTYSPDSGTFTWIPKYGPYTWRFTL